MHHSCASEGAATAPAPEALNHTASEGVPWAQGQSWVHLSSEVFAKHTKGPGFDPSKTKRKIVSQTSVSLHKSQKTLDRMQIPAEEVWTDEASDSAFQTRFSARRTLPGCRGYSGVSRFECYLPFLFLKQVPICWTALKPHSGPQPVSHVKVISNIGLFYCTQSFFNF